MKTLCSRVILLCALSGLILGSSNVTPLYGATVDELKQKIDTNTTNIKQLEQEIVQYQAQITDVTAQANTLKNTLKSIDISKKKLQAEISLTQNKISLTNSQIAQLSRGIASTNTQIGRNYDSVAISIRTVYKESATSLIESLLGANNLSEFTDTVEELSRLQVQVRDHIGDLNQNKHDLEATKTQTESKKKDLLAYTKNLADEQKLLQANERDKNNLLAQTKNQESNYRAIVVNKMAQKDQFEKELLAAESALKINVDPNSIPSTGTGVLKWPLDKIVITQYFGNTPFSTKNPQIYNGKGHTGVDFGTPIGTRVKAALDGIVAGSGNTDEIRGCYSYGKWILIKHPNGLSTLYGHLSLISVQAGDNVSTGQIIGYSGNTGYSTGPHLHFGVYASQGVEITRFDNSKSCKGAYIPLADIKAYLNPLSFL